MTGCYVARRAVSEAEGGPAAPSVSLADEESTVSQTPPEPPDETPDTGPGDEASPPEPPAAETPPEAAAEPPADTEPGATTAEPPADTEPGATAAEPAAETPSDAEPPADTEPGATAAEPPADPETPSDAAAEPPAAEPGPSDADADAVSEPAGGPPRRRLPVVPLLIVAAVVVAAGVAAVLLLGDDEESGPEQTVRDYFAAVQAVDCQGIVDLLSDEAIEAQGGASRDDTVTQCEDARTQLEADVEGLELRSVEVTSQEGDRATVDISTASPQYTTEQEGETATLTEEILLVEVDGDWLLAADAPSDDAPTP